MMKIFHSFLEGDSKEKTLKALRRFKEIADGLECTMAQLAMAWVIANPDITSAITGASRPEQLVDTCQALEVMKKLTPEFHKEVDEIFGSLPQGNPSMRDFQPISSRRKDLLKYYEQPPLDEAIHEELKEFVDRRMIELDGVELYS